MEDDTADAVEEDEEVEMTDPTDKPTTLKANGIFWMIIDTQSSYLVQSGMVGIIRKYVLYVLFVLYVLYEIFEKTYYTYYTK